MVTWPQFSSLNPFTAPQRSMKFDNASYEFIKAEHDPTIFSEAVGATVNELQQGAMANFEALTDWSVLAKDLKDLKKQKTESSTVEMTTTYLNNAERGPLVWQSLTPVEAFIAVDWNLDIEDEPLRILTSESAWAVKGK